MASTSIGFLGLFLFTLSWLVSDHYPPWLSFHSEALAWLSAAVLVFGILLRPGRTVAAPSMVVWIALTALVPWFQYLSGISLFAGDALMSSFYLSGLLGAVFVGYSLCRTDAVQTKPGPGITGLMNSLWIAAMLSAAIGLAQWFGVQEDMGMFFVRTDFGDRAMGNLGQPNHLASLLLMGLVAYAYAFEQRVFGRVAFVLGIAFMTAALVMAQSRAGMLSVVVVIAFLIWKKYQDKHRVSAKAVVIWAFCFLLGSLLLPSLSEALMLDAARDLGASGNVTGRLKMWQQMAYAVGQAPWFGYGWNQTPTAHAAAAVAYPGQITFTNAHNFVMDILAWNGLPLGLLLNGGIAYWFINRMKASVRMDAVYATACVLPVAVLSMLEYPFAYSYFLIPCGLMIGIVEANLPARKTVSLKRSWAFGLLATWALVGGYMTYEYFLIEEDFRIVRFENIRVGTTPAEYKVQDVWMLSHVAAMLKAARQVAQPNMSAADLENLRKVAERFAYGAIRLRYALALALNGNTTEASRQMAVIHGMYGDKYYAACMEEVIRLQNEQYPQLANIALPN